MKHLTGEQQFIVNDNINQRIWSVPEDGLLFRLRLDGGQFEVSLEGEGSADAGQLTGAIASKLRIEPVKDSAYPLRDYHPGIVKGAPVDTRKHAQD